MLTEGSSCSAAESKVGEWLKEVFSRHMNVPVGQLDDGESFFSLGLTSLVHYEVMAALTTAFGELSSTVLFEYPNFRLLAEHLASKHPVDIEILNRLREQA